MILGLVRHATTDWNAQDRYQSHTDLPSDNNVKGLERLPLASLRKIAPSTLATSPAVRAVATARHLANELPFREELIVRPEAVELNFGELEGIIRKDIQASPLADAYAEWQQLRRDRLPSGEAWTEIGGRARLFLSWVEQQEANVVLVTHSYFIRAVVSEVAGGWPPAHAAFLKVRNCSLTRLNRDGGGWSLDTANQLACASPEGGARRHGP